MVLQPVYQLADEAAGVPVEYVVDGTALPEERCRRCKAPVPGRLAMGLCSDCFSNLSEAADSYGGSEVERFERFMDLWRQL
jgi:hypothetical protein